MNAHSHVFDTGSARAERGTWAVAWITAATMVLEIGAGWWFNSMALLADGWHMSTHALAIGLAALAYGASRRYAEDPRFAFGSWKIEVLASFASALVLVGVAVLMVIGSIERLLDPQPIRYREAIAVAVLGLLVNVVCALILHRSGQGHDHHHGHGHGHGHGSAHDHDHDHPHDHDHGHDHPPGHDHGHHDLNLRAAYLHVVTDAATSLLAIVALLGGMWWGAGWLDPLMGIVGALLIGWWAKGLLRDSSRVLLDCEMDQPLVEQVRRTLQADGRVDVADLHLWRVGRAHWACAATLLGSDASLSVAAAHARLARHPQVVHATLELRPRSPAGPESATNNNGAAGWPRPQSSPVETPPEATPRPSTP